MIKKGVFFLAKHTPNPVFIAGIRAFATSTKLEKFDFQDPLCLEDVLTEEEKMVRESARSYA